VSGYTQAGLQEVARAMGQSDRSADERNRTRGITAHKDREAYARVEGLKIAIEVTGYQVGGSMDKETLAVYARQFATFILTGEML
jgi:hypothetical protein